jgi:hypothetical protein
MSLTRIRAIFPWQVRYFLRRGWWVVYEGRLGRLFPIAIAPRYTENCVSMKPYR